jgi:hypothetical protein
VVRVRFDTSKLNREIAEEIGGDVFMRGGAKQSSSLVEMHKHSKVERGDPEEQVSKHERGNYTPGSAQTYSQLYCVDCLCN